MYQTEKIESWSKYRDTHRIVRGVYRFSPIIKSCVLFTQRIGYYVIVSFIYIKEAFKRMQIINFYDFTVWCCYEVICVVSHGKKYLISSISNFTFCTFDYKQFLARNLLKLHFPVTAQFCKKIFYTSKKSLKDVLHQTKNHNWFEYVCAGNTYHQLSLRYI